ncbi:hypothetical protein ABT086_44980, partial [Streptomyces mirabilis]
DIAMSLIGSSPVIFLDEPTAGLDPEARIEVWQERGGELPLPGPAEERLLWFVREAWPSPATGTSLVAGSLTASAHLSLTVESDRLIAFGDGMESDAVELVWGQTVRVGVAGVRLRLVS